MRTDDWQKVKEIVADALELEAEKRAGFIAQSCDGNAGLREEVESLLAAHFAAGESYDTPAVEIVGDGLADLAQGFGFNRRPEQVGNYKIIEEIGRGGMGAVFLAERADAEFQKQVAVKIIKNIFVGAADVRRFRQERQILAALEHPHIARLLDGGTTADGLPFLVMEFVDGKPLNEFCEEQNLSLDERLRLFAQICDAVQFAHRNLVVHRDLKPSNVLVTADGAPKLLDFGIAKLLNEASNGDTKTEVRAFTPAYASPEQKRGEAVTTATDVYSLGAMLYELAPSPKADLQAIIEKAKREEPERRYQSVETLAADVRRFLAGLPVLARQGSFAYRAEKFAKRNRLAVAFAGLILLAIMGGIAATLWQAGAARKQAVIAAAERDRARIAQTRAERINQFLQKMLGSAAPRNEGREVKVVAVLAAAERQAQSDLQSEPEVLAAVLQSLGSTYNNLAQHADAERNLKNALLIYARFTDRENQIVAAETAGNLADVLLVNDKPAEAEPYVRQAVEIQRHYQPETNLNLAISLIQLGRTLIKKGEMQAAEPFLQEGLQLARQTEGEDGEVTLFALNQLGEIRRRAKDTTGYIAIYRQIVPVLRRKPQAKANLAISLVNLGDALTDAGEFAEAETLIQEGLNLHRELYGDENIYVAGATSRLSRLRLKQKRCADARAAAGNALMIQKKLLPPDHPQIAYTAKILDEAAAVCK